MKVSKNRRQKAEQKGRSAEQLAVWFLRIKGYSIVARRVRTPKGEIDIIARRGATYCFVEVKARKDFSTGISSVSQRQTRRIVAAARWWQATAQIPGNVTSRFDIILVKPYLSVRHITNAFDETGSAS